MSIENTVTNVSFSGRAVRAIVGAALIGLVMAQTTPLGWLAVLPLVAVYPLFVAITGVDPLLHGANYAESKLAGLFKRPQRERQEAFSH